MAFDVVGNDGEFEPGTHKRRLHIYPRPCNSDPDKGASDGTWGTGRRSFRVQPRLFVLSSLDEDPESLDVRIGSRIAIRIGFERARALSRAWDRGSRLRIECRQILEPLRMGRIQLVARIQCLLALCLIPSESGTRDCRKQFGPIGARLLEFLLEKGDRPLNGIGLGHTPGNR